MLQALSVRGCKVLEEERYFELPFKPVLNSFCGMGTKMATVGVLLNLGNLESK